VDHYCSNINTGGQFAVLVDVLWSVVLSAMQLRGEKEQEAKEQEEEQLSH